MTVGRKAWLMILTSTFLLAVILYFSCWSTGVEHWLLRDISKTLPLCLLSLITWLAGGRRFSILPLAFFFSMLGDLAGEHRNFILQIGMFAVAHIFFIADFSRRAKFDKITYVGATIVVIATIALGFTIVPNIAKPIEQYACILYIVLISTMAISAVAQQSDHRCWYIVAAILFIFSDSCIAWNRYMDKFPHAGLVIMSTYFAAQYLFARQYIKERTLE